MTIANSNLTSNRVALVAGATGLVGQAILSMLLADSHYSAVHVVGRRAPDVQHPKLVVHISASLADWTCPAVDDVFIALGTTIKVAGSRAAFKAIDGDAVVA
ncbi:MAG: nucleoside-diphosphate sugar epimerase, partial [Vitreoscilla sp.]|nr:nucleoside-diphosphate sugar epimerase [Polaromonas sp.]